MLFSGKDASEQAERWLDAHPEFVHSYFAKRATHTMIEEWLVSQAMTSTTPTPRALGIAIAGDAGSTGSGSRPNSGANTPVRKISAQEFERGGQILKPMVFTVDGAPTFLRQVVSGSAEGAGCSTSRPPRLSRRELKALDERELLYELVKDICNELDVRGLCHKILQNVSILLNADRCSLFLVRGDAADAATNRAEQRHLVSELFDVNSNSTLEECVESTREISVPWGVGIIGHVAETGVAVNIPDAYQDARFNRAVDSQTGYKTRSLLTMPIRDTESKVIGVAQAVNKVTIKGEPFNEHDEKVFSSYLAFCGIGINNAQLYERSQLENRRNQLLLDLARVIFEEQSNLATLIHKIMMHTQSLLRCQRCQVLLIEEGKLSQVFDLAATDFDNDDSYHREGTQEPRFPINPGITGHVATTGQKLNIPDAYKDERFDPAVDRDTDFRTRSILCMPIRNAQGHVIGVTQLVNKLDGTPFNHNDENIYEAFAIFFGLGISNTQMYEETVKAMAKQRVALEVLSYHLVAPVADVHRLKKLPVPSVEDLHLFNYDFNDVILDDDGTLKACIRMFLHLNMLERFRINYEVLCRWLLSVKKNYRNVSYHNWRHAFNVAQTMFCMLTHGEMKPLLGDLDCLALLVGCLCHDLDHRGTNNQFQIRTMSPLAQLYSTSTMEHHHFDQCIMILNTKGSDILSGLTTDENDKMMHMLEHAILATDLAIYFRSRNKFFDILDKHDIDYNRKEHRDLIRGMMMTACDVSAITKPWQIQKRVAELIASEFFEQGDLEKTELKIQPIDMLNREKKELLPSMQVGFIDSICLPVYKAFSKVNSKLEPLLEGCQKNRDRWQQLSDSGNETH